MRSPYSTYVHLSTQIMPRVAFELIDWTDSSALPRHKALFERLLDPHVLLSHTPGRIKVTWEDKRPLVIISFFVELVK